MTCVRPCEPLLGEGNCRHFNRCVDQSVRLPHPVPGQSEFDRQTIARLGGCIETRIHLFQLTKNAVEDSETGATVVFDGLASTLRDHAGGGPGQFNDGLLDRSPEVKAIWTGCVDQNSSPRLQKTPVSVVLDLARLTGVMDDQHQLVRIVLSSVCKRPRNAEAIGLEPGQGYVRQSS